MTAMADGIHALGWTLLHFLWQGAIVGLVFALVRASIPKHHCNARYANGLVALMSMAVLPVVTFLILHARQAAQFGTSAPAAALPDVVVSAAGKTLAATAPIEGVLPWIVGVWIVGVAFVGLRSWRQWRALARIARQWAEPDADLQRMVGALARRFDFVRQIRVLVSDRIDTPTLIGWIKPVILLPTAVALGFPRQQIELILAHELGHLRRYDHLVNLAQALLETLLFYHPVVHWIAREVRNEREICCDTLVLRLTSGEPREYAQTLAALEELRQPPVQLALAASGGVLLERVRRILFAPNAAVTQVGRRMWLPAVVTVAVALTVAMRVDRTEILQFDGPVLAAFRAPSALSLPGLDTAAFAIARPKFAVAERPRVEPVAPPPRADVADTVAVVDTPAAPAVAQTPVAERAVAVEMPAPALPAGRVVQDEAPAKSAPAPVAAATPDSLAAADVAPPKAAAVQAPEPAQAAEPAAHPRKMPVATRTVAPEYPSSVRNGRRARVELRFSINSDGAVRDIKVVAEPTDSAFTRAAERALQQWRFDPATVSTTRGHYRQAFVFTPENASDLAADTGACVRRTGSLLCQQRGEEPEESLPLDEKRMAAAAKGDDHTTVAAHSPAPAHAAAKLPSDDAEVAASAD